ncbi:helix-turn-helix domain-containing protein [Streptomyces sp. NBC_00237]|uniref:helix-turn-helix domain-containing protein n=1 Tax=Streptomyces sp. NBC_00237 TaxID=2975687 RepID=UPI002257C51C|nr:helix-turn-helix domain-containing protein [Streptomyces sp. NBC_00237]MCX5202470.1 helix-turn-helix domain-containing protein [Streptomyces sp. NBC_00237]
MPNPQLVTASDAAAYTGRSVGTIWRWASEGRISRYGTGKQVRYDLREMQGKATDEWTGEVMLAEPPPLPEGARAA